jgi:hypothetical protein
MPTLSHSVTLATGIQRSRAVGVSDWYVGLAYPMAGSEQAHCPRRRRLAAGQEAGRLPRARIRLLERALTRGEPSSMDDTDRPVGAADAADR